MARWTTCLRRSQVRLAIALALAVGIWLPQLHHLFDSASSTEGRQRSAHGLLEAQLAQWEDPVARERTRARMRAANAEWDFMGRTFFVLSLTNLALSEPSQADRYLAVVDQILADTLALEEELGQSHFMMDYVHRAPFLDSSGRSVFVDGEIALMMAARQTVRIDPRWERPLAARIERVSEQMRRGPTLSGESYPDECWTFCNTLALAAMRVADRVQDGDHSELMQDWVRTARTTLVDPTTGMLVSSYRYDGTPLDGPEGSTIFLVSHALWVVDREFAADQYRRARSELGRTLFGFGWAREWPSGWSGPADIDSGPVIPLVGASAGASGMALLGASAFEDVEWTEALHASLALAAFPVERDGGLAFAASNQVGDAVLLYSLVQGPLWQRVAGGAGAEVSSREGT